MLKIGFSALPTIIWRKQTNAPNKFMGSGMFPPGAYVTLEHEYILILRKGSKMSFKTEAEKIKRRESAFFWEERNSWFSDVWMDLKGTSQKLNDNRIRFRSAAFPFELPYRLINMFSVKGGIVLDPFLGTGTTMLAAMSSSRNSVGFEIDPNFNDVIINQANTILPFANEVIENRLEKHLKFIKTKLEDNYKFKYKNNNYGFPVMTKQEIDLCFNYLTSVKALSDSYIDVIYSDKPHEKFSEAWNIEVGSDTIKAYSKKNKQKSFF
jgi:modification methylase